MLVNVLYSSHFTLKINTSEKHTTHPPLKTLPSPSSPPHTYISPSFNSITYFSQVRSILVVSSLIIFFRNSKRERERVEMSRRSTRGVQNKNSQNFGHMKTYKSVFTFQECKGTFFQFFQNAKNPTRNTSTSTQTRYETFFPNWIVLQ